MHPPLILERMMSKRRTEYTPLTPEQVKQQESDHKNLVAAIRKVWGENMRRVMRKFGVNPPPMYVDRSA